MLYSSNPYGTGGTPASPPVTGGGAPAATIASTTSPVAPEAGASASTITEYFVMDAASLFSDTATTTAATSGGSVGSVKAKLSRTETLTQSVSGNQPTYTTESNSGRPGVRLGGNAFLRRSYLGPVGTMLVVYAADPAGNGRADQCLAHTVNAAGKNVSQLMLVKPSGGIGYDNCFYTQDRSDSTTHTVNVAPYFGDPDVLLMRTDGTTSEIDRACRTVGDPVTATGTAVTTGTYAALGAAVSSAGVGALSVKATVLAFVTWSTRLGDAEMRGVQRWAIDMTHQLANNTGRYLGFFFYGDGADENGTAQQVAFVNSDDLVTLTHQPIGAFQDAAGNAPQRDHDPVYDPTSGVLFDVVTSDQNLGVIDLYGIGADKFTMRLVKRISLAALTTTSAFCWSPSWVVNQDGSLWKDSRGLPAIFCAYGTNVYGNFAPLIVQPLDATWVTGGAWGTPVAVSGSFPARSFDFKCMMTSDNVFRLVWSSTPGIGYATASTVGGPYTVFSSGGDYFGFGSGLESPKVYHRAADNIWVMHLDRQGRGYSYATATAGFAGPYLAPATLTACPFIPQHGGMLLRPPGF